MPDFLGGYRPAALATKDGLNVLIEITGPGRPPNPTASGDTSQKVASRPGWGLDTIYSNKPSDSLGDVEPPADEIITRQADEVRMLNDSGHVRAAFVYAWPLLEAALINRTGRPATETRSPGEVIQSLALYGLLSPATEREVRRLATMRNRIVHADLGLPVSSQDVETVLAAVEEALGHEHLFA